MLDSVILSLQKSRDSFFCFKDFKSCFSLGFKKIVLKIEHIEKCITIDIFNDKIYFTDDSWYDIKLSSDSFNYILNNSFGFDTLTVNGCFEEGVKGGFEKTTKLFAIQNLNNLGIYFNISIIFNLHIFLLFL